ncbi:MAG: hypothetical protein V1792_03115 [Pseudomonadota bacterium]
MMKLVGFVLGLLLWTVMSPVTVSPQSDWMDGKVDCCIRPCT